MNIARVAIPARLYGAYIFDLDGTLVDSMEAHFRAWKKAFAASGAPREAFPWEEFIAHGGRSAQDVVASVNAAYGLRMDTAAVSKLKRQCYLDVIAGLRLPVVEETVDWVRRLRGKGIPYAIGTGSLRCGACATLAAAGIRELFALIVTPEDVEHGKPAPDMFLKAASLMGVTPSDCLVFEDARPGIEAARAAGMDYAVVSPPPSLPCPGPDEPADPQP